MRVHSSRFLHPGAPVLRLPSSPVHHRDLDRHLLLIEQGISPSVAVVYVPRSVLARSLAECWRIRHRPQSPPGHDQVPPDHLQDDEQRHLAPLVRSVQSCAVQLHRCEHLCASVQLVDADRSICVSPHRDSDHIRFLSTLD